MRQSKLKYFHFHNHACAVIRCGCAFLVMILV